jgi:hypothetical protein
MKLALQIFTKFLFNLYLAKPAADVPEGILAAVLLLQAQIHKNMSTSPKVTA